MKPSSNRPSVVTPASANLSLVSLDKSKISKEGFMFKKGYFSRFNSKYHMVIEDFYIKYGK